MLTGNRTESHREAIHDFQFIYGDAPPPAQRGNKLTSISKSRIQERIDTRSQF